jgi:hypothetical protein
VEVVDMLIGLVWSDGQPAVGTEYGPGDKPLCCPQCDTCAELIIHATRGEEVLGWLLRPCNCTLSVDLWGISVSADYAPDGSVISTAVEFVARAAKPAEEKQENHEAETEAPGADDVRAPGRRVRKAKPSGRSQAHRRAASPDDQEDEAG